RILADCRTLKSPEEKYLVLHHGSAYGSAELVAFQRAGFCREIVASIEQIVADELEQITMELIRAGLRHTAHGGRRSMLRSDAGRLDLEFLEGIRKRQCHIATRHKIDVIGAIKRVVHGIAQRAP